MSSVKKQRARRSPIPSVRVRDSAPALWACAFALILASAFPGNSATGNTQLAACLACHGASGSSDVPLVPSLGGQPVFYLTVQLLMFRDRLRIVEPMNAAMQGLKDDDLRAMAADLAKLPPPTPVAGPVDPARIDRARALIEQQRCNFCHQRNYSGDVNVPRLAGQREDYLIKALRDYKNNERRGYDAAMADVLYEISDRQILDLAYYLARLR